MPKPPGYVNPDFNMDLLKDPSTGPAPQVEAVEPPEQLVAISPSGEPVPILTQIELDFYIDKADRYRENYSFANVSDLLELDRILAFELLIFRFNQWLLRGGVDYDGNVIPKDVLKDSQAISKEIREIKTTLGIDKKTREMMKGGSTYNFVSSLTRHGKEFGIHRNNQVIEAINILKDLHGRIILSNNCTPEEQIMFDCRYEDIIEWILERLENFDEIDEMFRENHQRIWLRQELN